MEVVKVEGVRGCGLTPTTGVSTYALPSAACIRS